MLHSPRRPTAFPSLLLVLAAGCSSDGGDGSGETVDRGRGREDSGRRDSPDSIDRDDGDAAADDGSARADTADASGIADTDAPTPADSSDLSPEMPALDVSEDALIDGAGVYETDAGSTENPELCPIESQTPPLCETAIPDELDARRCDGFDNDCDGEIDEGCPCKVGEVRSCFPGPPGRANEGACEAGTMTCTAAGGTEHWGECVHAVAPTGEICNGLDDDCDGCTDELFGCDGDLLCPGPDDPRVPDGTPFTDYPLRGGAFYAGAATSWSWTVDGGPCDGILPSPSFTLSNADRQDATFHPLLSGSYTVHLRVVGEDGIVFECTWVVHVIGPGIRIEMCYPESTRADLDMLLMGPGLNSNWYPPGSDAFSPSRNACSWANCEAHLRSTLPRCDWGYATSPLENCRGGPLGGEWASLGSCANPRLDIDNNLSEGTGLPENINVDNPRDGDKFRIMIQNFTGSLTRPIVNIYCGGHLTATFGAAPDLVPGFEGTSGSFGVGAMWRVADVVAYVEPSGETIGCRVTPLHPAGESTGYLVTYDDPTF